MKLYFLLEESSMKLFLQGLIPRIFPDLKEDKDYFFRPHQGKNDLQEAIPRFVRAADKSSGLNIVIIHDQDSDDCKELKNILKKLCAGAEVPVLIRIPCRELEAWYLGDSDALCKVFPEFSKIKNKKHLRTDTDLIIKPSDILSKNISNFSKREAATEMGKIIDINNHKSTSFKFFIDGLNQFIRNVS